MIEFKGSLGKWEFSGRIGFGKKERKASPNLSAPSAPTETAATPKPEIQLSAEEKTILHEIESMEHIAKALDMGFDTKEGKILNEKITLESLQQFLVKLGTLVRSVEYHKYFNDQNIPTLQRLRKIWTKIDALTKFIVDNALGEAIDSKKQNKLQADYDSIVKTENYLNTLIQQFSTIAENSTFATTGDKPPTADATFKPNTINLANTMGHLRFCADSLSHYTDENGDDFKKEIYTFISQLEKLSEALVPAKPGVEPKTVPNYESLAESGSKINIMLAQLDRNISSNIAIEINSAENKRRSARKALKLPLSTD